MRQQTFFSIIIIIVMIFTLVTGMLIFFSYENSSTDSVFPLEIYGGTLVKFNSSLREAHILNQGFNLTLLNNPTNVNQSLEYSILILNIQTQDLIILGLQNYESYTKLNKTCVSLNIKTNSQLTRRIILFINTTAIDSFKIAVIGDTQGFTSFYQGLIDNSSRLNYEFILHLGDITPFGTQIQFDIFNRITRQSKIPVFFTPGNHDVKDKDSIVQYKKCFGKSDYFFIYGGILFISLDSSKGFFTEQSLNLLEDLLIQYQDLYKIIYSHIPIFDPRDNNDHSLVNKSQSNRFLNLIQDQKVEIILSGHIHYFNHAEINGTHFITSGGGGAALHEPKENGGFHHFTEIEIIHRGQSVLFQPMELIKKPDIMDILVIRGSSSNTISLNDLQIEFQTVSGYSSFQNQYGNWRAYGEYMGVRISDLLGTVGGIDLTQILEVEAWDGLKENYSYSTIFPNSSWQEIQGEMIVAYSYNGTFFPDWVDGYRIIFLPPDHAYSNADCKATSPPGEGYHIWPSAGYRWLKFIKSLKVINKNSIK